MTDPVEFPEDWAHPAALPMPEATLGGAAYDCIFVGAGTAIDEPLNPVRRCVVIGAGLPTPPGGVRHFAHIAGVYRGPLVAASVDEALDAIQAQLDPLGGITANEVDAAAEALSAVALLIPDDAVTTERVRAAAVDALNSMLA